VVEECEVGGVFDRGGGIPCVSNEIDAIVFFVWLILTKSAHAILWSVQILRGGDVLWVRFS
jgi:hypothetical protein